MQNFPESGLHVQIYPDHSDRERGQAIQLDKEISCSLVDFQKAQKQPVFFQIPDKQCQVNCPTHSRIDLMWRQNINLNSIQVFTSSFLQWGRKRWGWGWGLKRSCFQWCLHKGKAAGWLCIPIVTNINFLLMISINCQEQSL